MEFPELSDLTGSTANIKVGDGIGKATRLTLANAGAAVAVNELYQDEDLVNLVDVTDKNLGFVHISFNNADGDGGGRKNPFKISVEDFAWRFQSNLFSALRISQLWALH